MPNHFSGKEGALLALLKNPEVIKSYNSDNWTLLLRLAKKSFLLAHLGTVLKEHNLEHYIPEKIKEHITSAQNIIEYRKRCSLWEINRLWRALLDFDIDIILLKGVAYLLNDLPFSRSRVFSDIDILVDKTDIKRLEETLLSKNWKSENIDEYDQRYYRQWMHEIPPLKHVARTIEIDIHHTILPLTSRLQPNPELLISDAIDSGHYGFKTLSPCDKAIHSATHLFYDSDLNNKLKDLVDLDQLFCHFSNIDEDFYQKLIKRGQQLDLKRPIFYALRYTSKILGTSIPEEILRNKTGSPNYIISLMMDIMVPIAILPEHPDFPKKRVTIARWLLYVRSHYIRMPLKLLMPHLFYKSKLRWQENKETA